MSISTITANILYRTHYRKVCYLAVLSSEQIDISVPIEIVYVYSVCMRVTKKVRYISRNEVKFYFCLIKIHITYKINLTFYFYTFYTLRNPVEKMGWKILERLFYSSDLALSNLTFEKLKEYLSRKHFAFDKNMESKAKNQFTNLIWIFTQRNLETNMTLR